MNNTDPAQPPAPSFEDRCRAWIEKQTNWEAKVELGRLLMIPITALSSTQLTRLDELKEIVKSTETK
jgi:hypothetical protein